MILTIENPVTVSVDNNPNQKILRPVLEYDSVWYKQGRYHQERQVRRKSFVKYKKFPAGFLPRIETFLKRQKIDYEVKNREWLIGPTPGKPHIDGITFRPDQEILINNVLEQGRGVVLSPTGSGKTIIAMGVMSCFPNSNILFLCHTLDIITQTVTELTEKGFTDVCMMGGGQKDMHGRIIVSTIQTFVKLNPDDYIDRFDVVIYDEVHHVSSEKGQPIEVLSQILTPIRVGFTATLPESIYAKLCIEGFLGPVIGEFKIKEGVELGILATPTITLLPVPKNSKINRIKKYDDTYTIDKETKKKKRTATGIYTEGIVNNKARNRIACSEISKRVKEGKSCLIMVKEIQHGNNLEVMLKEIFNTDVVFIHGITEKETRQQVKEALEAKNVKAVICTKIWNEGINIKSINVIMNAGAGKSYVVTLQIPGRGLRTTDTKTTVEIIDFLDPYPYLNAHCVERLIVYAKSGWL